MKHSTYTNNCNAKKEAEYNGANMSRLEQGDTPLTMKEDAPYSDVRKTEPENISAVPTNRNGKEYEPMKDDVNMQESSNVPSGPRRRLYFLNQATSKHNSNQRNEKFSHGAMNQRDHNDEYYYYED